MKQKISSIFKLRQGSIHRRGCLNCKYMRSIYGGSRQICDHRPGCSWKYKLVWHNRWMPIPVPGRIYA